MPSRVRLAVLSLALVAPVTIAATPAGAACASGTKTLTGSIAGQDGRYVDAMIGFDILNSHGQALDSAGCTGVKGYGATVRVNSDLPATGSTTTGTKSWRVTLPGNATAVYIETYPAGPRYAGTDESRYGHSMRRKVAVPYGTGVALRLPLVCEAAGATGGVNGYVTYQGVRTQADRVAAWSMATDNNTASPIMGWNVGTAATNGYYKINHLASGQYYTVRITERGVTKQFYKVAVSKCHNAYLSAAF